MVGSFLTKVVFIVIVPGGFEKSSPHTLFTYGADIFQIALEHAVRQLSKYIYLIYLIYLK